MRKPDPHYLDVEDETRLSSDSFAKRLGNKAFEMKNSGSIDFQILAVIAEFEQAFNLYLMTQRKDEAVCRFFFTTCLVFGGTFLAKILFDENPLGKEAKIAAIVILIVLISIGFVVGSIVMRLYRTRFRAISRMNFLRRWLFSNVPDLNYDEYKALAGFQDISDASMLWNNRGPFILIILFEFALFLATIYILSSI